MDFKSNTSKAKGLGSAKSGTHHWLMQRLSAVILLLLVIWLVQFCYGIGSKSILTILDDLRVPYNTCGFALLVLSSLYHGMLGMQVIIEDYIHCLKLRYFLIIALKILVVVTVAAFITALIYLLKA